MIVEEKLAEILSEVLGVKKIGIQDNFFDFGGHSITAIKFIFLVNKVFNVSSKLRDLFEYLTIQEMAKKVDKLLAEKDRQFQGQEDIPSPIITLKKGNMPYSLFFIHPMGGAIFGFIPLSKHIKTDISIHAIQDPGIETGKHYFTNFDDWMDFYLDHIRKVQPQGPYLIGGASSGGNIAVELVRKLKEQGEEIISLLLLDSWAFYTDDFKDRQFFEDGLRVQHVLWEKAFREAEIKDVSSFFDLQWQRGQWLTNYKIQTIKEKVVLFKAKKHFDLFVTIEDSHNQWNVYTKNIIQVVSVAGDHLSMYQEPYVKDLAKKLDKVLSAVK